MESWDSQKMCKGLFQTFSPSFFQKDKFNSFLKRNLSKIDPTLFATNSFFFFGLNSFC